MTGTDKKKWGWIIILGAAAVYLGALWHRPLFAPDEVRYALIPREMLLSGSWAVPTLNGLLYFEKPAAAYWPAALSMKLLGSTPFAVRLPSALFTLLTAGAVYLLGLRSGSRKTGICAALLYLVSGLVFAVGTYAVLDAYLVFFLTAAVAAGFYYDTEKQGGLRLLYLAAAGLFLGAGVLVKGLLAPLLAALLFTAYFFWKKQFGKWAFALLPVTAGLLLGALPAALFIHRHAPGFWQEFILTEHLSRAVSGAGAADDRARPFWYYLPVFTGTLLPVLFLMIPGFWGIRKRAKEFFFKEDLDLLCTLALVLWFVFFSCVRAKLGTYILPLFPFAALLTARSLLEAVREERTASISRVLKLLTSVIGGGVVLFVVWHLLPAVPGKLKLFSFRELVPGVMTAGILLLWYSMAAREKEIYPQRKFLYFCLGTAAVMLSVHHIMPQKIVRKHDQAGFIRRAVVPHLRPGAAVFADGKTAASAAWVLRRNVEIFARAGELAPGLAKAGRKPVTVKELNAFLPSALAKGQQVVIITQSPRRLKGLLSRTGKTTVRSGRMAAVIYGEHIK